MNKYVITSCGIELDEEDLKDLYRLTEHTAFNEKSYEMWKSNLLKLGKIHQAGADLTIDQIVCVLKDYKRMIERNGKEYPTVVLDDIYHSLNHVIGRLEK